MALLFVAALILIASSLAVHEFGHWWVLRKLHIPVTGISIGAGPAIARYKTITLRLFPILVSLHFNPEDWQAAPAKGRLRAALGGPLASLCYAALLAAAGVAESSPGLMSLASLNIAIAAINLLPVPPLDGWQAMCACVEWMTGKPLPSKYLQRANRLGNAFIYGIGALLLYRLIFQSL